MKKTIKRLDWRWRQPPKQATAPAAKLKRCLLLIRRLESERLDIGEIARFLDSSERTVYRYVSLFEECGFLIDKDFNKKFFIAKEV